MDNVKVTVVGAGAIGGLFAGWLASVPQCAANLSMIARGDTLHALRTNGLRLVQEGATHTIKVNVTDDPDTLGVQDLVIVAVKGPALSAVAPVVKSLMGKDTKVLVAMNGVPWWFFHGFGSECEGVSLRSVDLHGLIEKNISSDQVVGAVLHASASVSQPSVINHVAGNRLIIGAPDANKNNELEPLKTLLQSSGWDVSLSECIQKNIWYKLWGNMTMNPVSALTGATCDRILDDPLVRAFCSAVMLEAQAIGNRIGCSIDQTPEERHSVTRKLGAFKTSMLQDVEAQRPLEVDSLIGAVKEIGQHLGIATPNTDALLGLIRLMGQSRGLYPMR
jgi:2-dehydropantoate 2-reductase